MLMNVLSSAAQFMCHKLSPCVCFTTASIPVVGFNAVLTSEHFGSFLTFGVLHAALLIQYIKVRLRPLLVMQAKLETGAAFCLQRYTSFGFEYCKSPHEVTATAHMPPQCC